MKKLLFVLPVFFFSLVVNAQTQTEDEIYIGKGKTFGKYKGTAIIIPETDKGIKPIVGQNSITGTVVGNCKKDCCNKKLTSCSVDVRKDDGSIVTVGTRDNGFTVPKAIVGQRIIIEGIDPAKLITKKKTLKRDFQRDIQFVATGLRIL